MEPSTAARLSKEMTKEHSKNFLLVIMYLKTAENAETISSHLGANVLKAPGAGRQPSLVYAVWKTFLSGYGMLSNMFSAMATKADMKSTARLPTPNFVLLKSPIRYVTSLKFTPVERLLFALPTRWDGGDSGFDLLVILIAPSVSKSGTVPFEADNIFGAVAHTATLPNPYAPPMPK